jgi:hypothetical protein
VALLRRFCRAQQFEWCGIVRCDGLQSSLRRGCKGVAARLVTGKVVLFNAVVVPNYTVLDGKPPFSGAELLHRLAHLQVPVLSATPVLTTEEVAFWKRHAEVIIRHAA